MSRLAPLPASLPSAFTVEQARQAGVGRSRLRHRSLHAPTRAVRTTRPAGDVVMLACSVAPVLPSPWAFSHVTAARLLGLPLPLAWSVDAELEVMRPSDKTRVRRVGVVGHRGLESRDLTIIHGMPVITAPATWLDLAAELSLDDLVVAGDVIARRDPDSLPQLRLLMSASRGRRATRRALEALSLVRTGSASPMETRTRLAFVRHGLPEPELNAPIFDASGEWVAMADFVWREERVLVEYEGDQHRADRRRWQADIARQRLLEALGWNVVRITARDLQPDRVPDTMALVASALEGRRRRATGRGEVRREVRGQPEVRRQSNGQ